MSAMSESQLVYSVMQELGKYGYVVRCNSGSVPLSNGKRFRAMPRGFADIMAIMPGGRVAFIECKTDNGKPTPEQIEFIEKMRKLGCMAGIAHNVDEALEICGLQGKEISP